MNIINNIGAPPNLDAIFSALADPTRRDILSNLKDGPASVSQICARYEMSQPAISKHLKVLEKAGLVDRNTDQQRRPAALNAQNLNAATLWINEFKAFWDGSFDQLDTVLHALNNNDNK